MPFLETPPIIIPAAAPVLTHGKDILSEIASKRKMSGQENLEVPPFSPPKPSAPAWMMELKKRRNEKATTPDTPEQKIPENSNKPSWLLQLKERHVKTSVESENLRVKTQLSKSKEDLTSIGMESSPAKSYRKFRHTSDATVFNEFSRKIASGITIHNLEEKTESEETTDQQKVSTNIESANDLIKTTIIHTEVAVDHKTQLVQNIVETDKKQIEKVQIDIDNNKSSRNIYTSGRSQTLARSRTEEKVETVHKWKTVGRSLTSEKLDRPITIDLFEKEPSTTNKVKDISPGTCKTKDIAKTPDKLKTDIATVDITNSGEQSAEKEQTQIKKLVREKTEENLKFSIGTRNCASPTNQPLRLHSPQNKETVDVAILLKRIEALEQDFNMLKSIVLKHVAKE